MRKLFSILAASLVVALLLPAAAATSAPCYWHSDKEKGFAKKINGSRERSGRRQLRLDPHLSRVATKQTSTMVSKNYLHHTPNLGQRVTRWKVLGENVGYGSSVKSLHKLFMNSPAHKANILDGRFRFVGVGTKQARGHLWVTVVFQASKNPGTTLEMPKC